MSKTKLIVISGPSGCGKTTIAKEILRRHLNFFFSVSGTTRTKRSVEIDGKDYFFLTKEQFEYKIRHDELAEWEQIYGNYYGSLRSEIERAFSANTSILFDVDVNGALSIKRKYPQAALLIFIKPPSMELLTERLKNRKTETPDTFAKRMERVEMELGLAVKFDYTIINETLEQAVDKVDEIIDHVLQST